VKLLLVGGIFALTSLAAADEPRAPAAHGYRLQVRSIAGCEGLPV
jgi:hypothetical protein